MCGSNSQRVKIEIHGKVIEQEFDFIQYRKIISKLEKDIAKRLQRYNRISAVIETELWHTDLS